MLDTDLKFCEKDLMEVIKMFDGGDKLSIRHLFSRKENRIVNTVNFNGKAYAYGNLVKDFKDETEEKRILKRYAKLSLYKALSAYFNVNLPWGALTGIRPTKLAYSEMAENGEFTDFFINTLKVSEEKTLLIKDVLETQKGLIDDKNSGQDFFVFIPFCPTRCKYCSFISADLKSAKKYVDKYVETLVYEIEKSAKYVKNLRSIYIGGGTPVSLSNENLEKVLSAIDKINTGVEFTVEAGRPEVISKENLEILKKHKVTRICINPQTFNDKTLNLIGRKHTAKDVTDKYELAKNDFIINMDLIAGLDGETFEDFKHSIDTAISLSPDNITVHTLCIKRGSELSDKTDRLNIGEIEKMVTYAENALKEKGYKPYYLYRQKYMAGNLENVGYTKEGKACIYNIDVMEETNDVVACGSNAISKVVILKENRIERLAPPKDVATYIDKINIIIDKKDKFFG